MFILKKINIFIKFSILFDFIHKFLWIWLDDRYAETNSDFN